MNRIVRKVALPIVIGTVALVGGYLSSAGPQVQPDRAASIAAPNMTAIRYTAADMNWG